MVRASSLPRGRYSCLNSAVSPAEPQYRSMALPIRVGSMILCSSFPSYPSVGNSTVCTVIAEARSGAAEPAPRVPSSPHNCCSSRSSSPTASPCSSRNRWQAARRAPLTERPVRTGWPWPSRANRRATVLRLALGFFLPSSVASSSFSESLADVDSSSRESTAPRRRSTTSSMPPEWRGASVTRWTVSS